MYCISQACHSVKMHIGSTLVLPGPNCVSNFVSIFVPNFVLMARTFCYSVRVGLSTRTWFFGLQLQRQIWIGFHITWQFGNFVRSPLGDVLCYLGLSFSHNAHWVCFGSTWAQFCFQICFQLLVLLARTLGYSVCAGLSTRNWFSDCRYRVRSELVFLSRVNSAV